MTNADLEKLCLGPPQKWLAIHKENGKSMRVQAIDLDRRKVFIEESGYWNFSDCHICPFTGCVDSQGEKVYGGHVRFVSFPGNGHYVITVWKDNQWTSQPFGARHITDDYPMVNDIHLSTIIGHIHIKPWSEEVRGLLE